jgi:hypothetical protein
VVNVAGRYENEVTSRIPGFLRPGASSERFGPLVLDRQHECGRMRAASAIDLRRMRAETETSYRFVVPVFGVQVTVTSIPVLS